MGVCPYKKWNTSGLSNLTHHNGIYHTYHNHPESHSNVGFELHSCCEKRCDMVPMRPIHCYWPISKPCLKAYLRKKMSTMASTSPFGVILGHIIIRFHCQNIRKIIDLGVDSQPGGKGKDGEQGQPFISLLLKCCKPLWVCVHIRSETLLG